MYAHPFSSGFGVEITGADLTRPDAALAETCLRLFETHALCVFRDVGFDDDTHVRFSRLFGDLEQSRPPRAPGTKSRFDHVELFDVSNLDADGNIRMDQRRIIFMRGNQQWHTDSSFRRLRASYSMLRADLVPPKGGDTQFADMRAAYVALPDTLKSKIAGREAIHSIWHSRQLAGYPPATPEELAMLPGARQPLILSHPRTGRPALYLARHAEAIVGLGEEEARALLDELIRFATQEQFVHTHRWRNGDLVVWDNRCTMHRATPFDDTRHPRDMRRTTVIDPDCQAESTSVASACGR